MQFVSPLALCIIVGSDVLDIEEKSGFWRELSHRCRLQYGRAR